MTGLPEPDWYLDTVQIHAQPGTSAGAVVTESGRWRRWWSGRAALGPDAALAAQQGMVLSTGDLPRVSRTRSFARAAAQRNEWEYVRRGFWTPFPLATPDDRPYEARRRRHAVQASASVLARPETVVSGRSAAILHGLPTMSVPPMPETTRTSSEKLGRRGSSHLFGAELGDRSISAWFGIPITTVARTVLDLARHSRRDGIMAADAALRDELVDRKTMERELDDAIGWPGVRQARSVIGAADPLAESPLESITRLALADEGLPRPQLQVVLAGFRVDACWPERRLILEMDGLDKYTDDAWRKEKQREQVLRRIGWRIERVTWDDVVRHWPATAARLWPYFLPSSPQWPL